MPWFSGQGDQGRGQGTGDGAWEGNKGISILSTRMRCEHTPQCVNRVGFYTYAMLNCNKLLYKLVINNRSHGDGQMTLRVTYGECHVTNAMACAGPREGVV